MLCMVYFKNQNSIGFVLPPFARFQGGAGCLPPRQAARLTHAGTVSSRIWRHSSTLISFPLAVPTKMVIDELKLLPKQHGETGGYIRDEKDNLYHVPMEDRKQMERMAISKTRQRNPKRRRRQCTIRILKFLGFDVPDITIREVDQS